MNAITVENVSKRYLIDHQARSDTLRDALMHGARGLWNRLRHGGLEQEEFWALRDVSFAVKPGEVLGIIGRNGAGKSTLLKILSRITEPTTGQIKLRGRVASLLEVGTGFHPELSGRENIYLNGAILGMSRAEIRRRFDEIVAFAEVERFLDTPVKRYSSGMYVRLAFAVAAHLEPEILIVDEVLAVGDAQFQRKCLGKIQSVAQNQGRTILFVSHQMNTVQRLCTRVIAIKRGGIIADGPPSTVIPAFLSEAAPIGAIRDLTSTDIAGRRGTGAARFVRVELQTADGGTAADIRRGEPLRVRLILRAFAILREVTFGFSFVAADGTEIMGTTAHDSGITRDLQTGLHQFSCLVDPMILNPGRYYLRAAIFRVGEVFDHIDEIISFEVLTANTNQLSAPSQHWVGHVYLPFRWQTEDYAP